MILQTDEVNIPCAAIVLLMVLFIIIVVYGVVYDAKYGAVYGKEARDAERVLISLGFQPSDAKVAVQKAVRVCHKGADVQQLIDEILNP